MKPVSEERLIQLSPGDRKLIILLIIKRQKEHVYKGPRQYPAEMLITSPAESLFLSLIFIRLDSCAHSFTSLLIFHVFTPSLCHSSSSLPSLPSHLPLPADSIFLCPVLCCFLMKYKCLCLTFMRCFETKRQLQPY